MAAEQAVDAPRHARREGLSLSAAAVAAAQTLVALAVIGIAVGLAVLVGYGVHRHAFPAFDSDEWLPQLLSIGFWCGLVVGFLACVPLLDRLALDELDRGMAPTPGPSRRQPLREWGLHAVLGLGLLCCVAWISSPLMQGLASVVLAAAGALGSLYFACRVDWRRQDRARDQRVELLVMFFGSHILHQMLLLLAWALALDRIQSRGAWQWAVAAAVVVVLGLVRTGVVGLRSSPAATLGTSAMALVVVGWMFSPQIVRMAGLANLPNMRLHLERVVACEIARHLPLTQEEVVAECAKPATATLQPQLSVDVDVVSRIGGQYLLSWPGALAQFPNAACDHLHRVRPPRPDPDDTRLRCAEIPRTAVRTLLR